MLACALLERCYTASGLGLPEADRVPIGTVVLAVEVVVPEAVAALLPPVVLVAECEDQADIARLGSAQPAVLACADIYQLETDAQAGGTWPLTAVAFPIGEGQLYNHADCHAL